jgi:hypothetical protein
MKSRIALTLVLTSLLLVLTFSARDIQQAKAQPPPVFPMNPPVQIYIDPPTSVAFPGGMANVSIYVSTPIDLTLFGWRLKLQYDPSILNYTSITYSWTGAGATVNRTTGLLYAANGGNLFDVSSALPLKFLTVTFHGIAYGTSSINVTSFDLIGISDSGNGWTPGTDPYNGIPEFTEYDIWPDVNNDGVIDYYDAVLLAGHFSVLNPVNDTICDFNNDSFVDIFDACILASDFGMGIGNSRWPNSTYPTGLTHTMYVFNETIQNGSVQVTIPGDINGDFTVDIYDAIKLAAAYNSTALDPNWNPNADINGDGWVDIYDAIILAGHYNEHYP